MSKICLVEDGSPPPLSLYKPSNGGGCSSGWWARIQWIVIEMLSRLTFSPHPISFFSSPLAALTMCVLWTRTLAISSRSCTTRSESKLVGCVQEFVVVCGWVCQVPSWEQKWCTVLVQTWNPIERTQVYLAFLSPNWEGLSSKMIAQN